MHTSISTVVDRFHGAWLNLLPRSAMQGNRPMEVRKLYENLTYVLHPARAAIALIYSVKNIRNEKSRF